jgi:hypothetical protein
VVAVCIREPLIDLILMEGALVVVEGGAEISEDGVLEKEKVISRALKISS